MDCSSFIESLPTDVTEPTFMVRRFRPAMCYRILDQARCNSGAWRDNVRDTFFMNNEVANCWRRNKRNQLKITEHFQSIQVLSKLKHLLWWWRQQKQHAFLIVTCAVGKLLFIHIRKTIFLGSYYTTASTDIELSRAGKECFLSLTLWGLPH